MSRILLTGATGLLGSRAVRLFREHHEVHAVVRSLPSVPLEGVTYHAVDLSRFWKSDHLPHAVDAVFHLAQSHNFREFPACALETYWVNGGATAILLDYAARAGAQRFILASTGGLYGTSINSITEETPLSPPDGPLCHYFNTKLGAEVLTGAYRAVFDVTILRPFFIYGPGQSKDKFMPRLVESVRNRTAIRLTGENGTLMNPVHVDDAARVLLETLTFARSQTLNIAGPQVVSVRQIAERIGDLVSMPPNLIVEPGEPQRLVADTHRLIRILGQNFTSFDDGIKSMLSV